MKKILSILLLSSLLFSCENRDEKIEIYLLKNKVRTSEGIPVLEYVKLKNIKYDKNLENVKDCNYDSISKQFIYGGKFTVEKENIETKPLIKDEDVLKLNLEKSELILSENAKNSINQLKPNMKNGIQFVICVNRQPLLTGYFRSNISSNIYNWNYIGYDYFEHKTATIHDKNFVIRQNDGYEKWKPILCNLNEYPELISAFKNTNRIIE
jgi:hypothetical protein